MKKDFEDFTKKYINLYIKLHKLISSVMGLEHNFVVKKYSIKNKYSLYPKIYEKYKHKYNYQEFRKLFSENKIEYNYKEYPSLLDDILYNSTFIDIDIIHDFEKYNLLHTIYRSSDIEINIWSHDNTSPKIDIIYHLIELFKKISNNKKKIQINILYSDRKKYLPDTNNTVLTKSNINSGASYHKRMIIVFRKEEFYKVLLHELTHYYDIIPSINLDNHLKFLKYDNVDILNETFTELYATTLYLVLQSIDLRKSIKESYITFYILYNTELNYRLKKTGEILGFFNASSFQDYLNGKITLKQTTSVRSYVIINSLLFFDYNSFILLYNGSKDSNKYHDIIDKTKNNARYNKIVNSSILKFSKLNKHKRSFTMSRPL